MTLNGKARCEARGARLGARGDEKAVARARPGAGSILNVRRTGGVCQRTSFAKALADRSPDGIRACLKIEKGPAAKDLPPGGFARKGWSGGVAPRVQTQEGYARSSRLAIPAFPRKQDPFEFSERLQAIGSPDRVVLATWIV